MIVLGINYSLGWVQIVENGIQRTCLLKEQNGEFFFKFKNEWHKVSEYTYEGTAEY